VNSLMFNLNDIKQVFQSIRWFLGRGPRPHYGRFTYWEKFDYFAVFWGVFIIGSTGLVLWFPELFTRIDRGADFRQLDVNHLSELVLGVFGDANHHPVVLDAGPLVRAGVQQISRNTHLGLLHLMWTIQSILLLLPRIERKLHHPGAHAAITNLDKDLAADVGRLGGKVSHRERFAKGR